MQRGKGSGKGEVNRKRRQGGGREKMAPPSSKEREKDPQEEDDIRFEDICRRMIEHVQISHSNLATEPHSSVSQIMKPSLSHDISLGANTKNPRVCDGCVENIRQEQYCYKQTHIFFLQSSSKLQ